MDNLIREGEQAFEGQSGGGNQGNMGGGGNQNYQGESNMREGNMGGGGGGGGSGGGNMMGGGGNMTKQSGGQSSGGGGGFLGGLEKTGENVMIDQGTHLFFFLSICRCYSSPLSSICDPGWVWGVITDFANSLPAEVNQFATKEGVPVAMDPLIDQFVNKEV